MSKLYFKYGTMNSGKSMFLLATAHNFEERNIHFLCLKSNIDTRDGENIIKSRALGDRDCIMIDKNDDIYESIFKYMEYDKTNMNSEFLAPLQWILVDEAQFLTEIQVDQLAKIVDDMKVSVICYGLRSDFKTKLFIGSKRLFEIADSFEEIKSTCHCGNKNIVNARLDENHKIITEGEQILIGDNDMYLSMCRKCYNNFISKL